jgi:hypothetical protein
VNVVTDMDDLQFFFRTVMAPFAVQLFIDQPVQTAITFSGSVLTRDEQLFITGKSVFIKQFPQK